MFPLRASCYACTEEHDYYQFPVSAVMEIPPQWITLLEEKPLEISNIIFNFSKKRQAIIKFLDHALEDCENLLNGMQRDSGSQKEIIANYLNFLLMKLPQVSLIDKLGRLLDDANLLMDVRQKAIAREIVDKFITDLAIQDEKINAFLGVHGLKEFIRKPDEKNIEKRKTGEDSNNKDDEFNSSCYCKIT